MTTFVRQRTLRQRAHSARSQTNAASYKRTTHVGSLVCHMSSLQGHTHSKIAKESETKWKHCRSLKSYCCLNAAQHVHFQSFKNWKQKLPVASWAETEWRIIPIHNKNLLPYLFNATASVGSDFLDRVQPHVSSLPTSTVNATLSSQ